MTLSPYQERALALLREWGTLDQSNPFGIGLSTVQVLRVAGYATVTTQVDRRPNHLRMTPGRKWTARLVKDTE